MTDRKFHVGDLVQGMLGAGIPAGTWRVIKEDVNYHGPLVQMKIVDGMEMYDYYSAYEWSLELATKPDDKGRLVIENGAAEYEEIMSMQESMK